MRQCPKAHGERLISILLLAFSRKLNKYLENFSRQPQLRNVVT